MVINGILMVLDCFASVASREVVHSDVDKKSEKGHDSAIGTEDRVTMRLEEEMMKRYYGIIARADSLTITVSWRGLVIARSHE